MFKLAPLALAAAVTFTSVGAASAQDFRRQEMESQGRAPWMAQPHGAPGGWHGQEMARNGWGQPRGYAPPPPPVYRGGYGYRPEYVQEDRGPDMGAALVMGAIAGGLIAAAIANSQGQ